MLLESHTTRTKYVAAGRLTRSSFKSKGGSKYCSAGLGNPATTDPAICNFATLTATLQDAGQHFHVFPRALHLKADIQLEDYAQDSPQSKNEMATFISSNKIRGEMKTDVFLPSFSPSSFSFPFSRFPRLKVPVIVSEVVNRQKPREALETFARLSI